MENQPSIADTAAGEEDRGCPAISGFEKELSGLLNTHSKEGDSDTPDYVLAYFLERCLDAFNGALSMRTTWYGNEDKTEVNKIDKVTGSLLDHRNARLIAEAAQDLQDPEVDRVIMIAEDPSTLTNLAACYLDLAEGAS